MQKPNRNSQQKPHKPADPVQKVAGDELGLDSGNSERREKSGSPPNKAENARKMILYSLLAVGIVVLLAFSVSSKADETEATSDVPVFEIGNALIPDPSEDETSPATEGEESPGFFARAGKAFHVMTGDEDHDIEYVNARMKELEELSHHLELTTEDNEARAAALEAYGKMLDARSAKLKEISASLITKAEQIAKDTSIAVDTAWVAP